MKSIVSALAMTATMVIAQESQVYSNGFSPIKITVDGYAQTYYIAAYFQSYNENEFVVPPNGRGIISRVPWMSYDDDMYFKPNLLGGSIWYTVDLSQHECNCVAAAYLVKMPGKDSNGNTWWDTDGYGYCDAQAQGGNLCPEVDLMEANKYAF